MIYGDYYIDLIDDVGENAGGYYCIVYDKDDIDHDHEIDSFCIWHNDTRPIYECIKEYLGGY